MNLAYDRGPSGRAARYDPRHDPLVTPQPGQGQDYAPTYWVATAGPKPADDGSAAAAPSLSRFVRPGQQMPVVILSFQ